eukprot:COSAG02_NODE_236_length_27740_cov_49.156073_12_plen_1555_part_00
MEGVAEESSSTGTCTAAAAAAAAAAADADDADKDVDADQLGIAISSYVATETERGREPPPFEAELSVIAAPADRTARRREQRRAGLAAVSTSESESESESESDGGDAADASAPAASVSRGLEDDVSLRYVLDVEAVAADLHSVVDATVATLLRDNGSASSPSSAGKRVRQILRRLEVDLEKMAQDAKHSWRMKAAEHLRQSDVTNVDCQENAVAVHMQKFFSATREHVTLAQKHVVSAEVQQRAVLAQQLELCTHGLLTVARNHVKAAVAEQTDEARAVIEWQRRERQDQLEDSRHASSVAMQQALGVTRLQASEEQAAMIVTHKAERIAAVAEVEHRMNEERLKAVMQKDAALQLANSQVSEISDENEELKLRLSALQVETLGLKEQVHRTESQLAAASAANKRLDAKLANSKAELADEQRKRTDLEQALAQEQRKTEGLVAKLQEMVSEFEGKLAASTAHASACQAELDHAHEELSQTQDHLAEGGVVSRDSREPTGGVEWNTAFDVEHMLAEDAAGARVPSQILDREQARLMAAVNRAAKAGMVVQLLSTPKSKKHSDHNSPANIAKLMRSNTRRRLESKTATDTVNDADAERSADTRRRDVNQSLNLRETLALTHELSEHASRSLRLSDEDDPSPRRRHERQQWKEKITMPGGLVSAMNRKCYMNLPSEFGPSGDVGTGGASGIPESAYLPTSLLHDAYEYFLGTTGHARLALTRMSKFHKALVKHRSKHPRLEIWSRFLGFATPAAERYPINLFHAYLNVLQYVQTLQRDSIQVEADGTLWVPQRAGVRAAERCFACWLRAEQLEKMLKEGSARLGVASIALGQKVLPFDAFIAPLMGASLKAMIGAAQTLRVLYWAADVRVDGQLSLKECKQLITQVVEIMKDGGSFDETAPSHAVCGDSSANNLLSFYRRLGLDSDEHGSISEEAWVRTAFDAGLIPTHDTGGRPFLRAANACWSAPHGALQRIQAILRRLERKQSELLQREDTDDGTSIERVDDEIADWTKRRDRVEAILRKKLPAHGGRESGIGAVRAVRALALRIKEAEGRTLSVEEAAVLQQTGDHEGNMVRQGSVVINPTLPALPPVEWGSEAARERFQELQMEKEHILSQLTTLRLDSEELVSKQQGFSAEKDKLKAEIASLKKILMKHTMSDVQEEMREKDAKIAELNLALHKAEAELEEMRKAAAAVADTEHTSVPRKKTLVRTLSRTRISLGRAQRTGSTGDSLSPSAAASIAATTVPHSENSESADQVEPSGSNCDTEIAESGAMEKELLKLRAQLAVITPSGNSTDVSPSRLMPMGQVEDDESVRMIDDGEAAQIAAVRQLATALKAVGQVTGLNEAVHRKPGFALASTAVMPRPISSGVDGSTSEHTAANQGRGEKLRHSSSSTEILGLSVRGRPPSGSTRRRQKQQLQPKASVRLANEEVAAPSHVSDTTDGNDRSWMRRSSTSNVKARAAMAKVLSSPPANLGNGSVKTDSTLAGVAAALTLSALEPRRQGMRPASAGSARRGSSRSKFASISDKAKQRPSSARVVRPKSVPALELVWAGEHV